MVLELFAGVSALLEEVGAEPDLLQVRLMRVFSQDLLDCHLPFATAMDAQPDHTEPTSAQQCNSLKLLGEAIAKFLELFRSQHTVDIKLILSMEFYSRVLDLLIVNSADFGPTVVVRPAGRLPMSQGLSNMALVSVFEQLFEVWDNEIHTVSTGACEKFVIICSLRRLDLSISAFRLRDRVVEALRGQTGPELRYGDLHPTLDIPRLPDLFLLLLFLFFFNMPRTKGSCILLTYNFLDSIFYLILTQGAFVGRRVLRTGFVARLVGFMVEVLVCWRQLAFFLIQRVHTTSPSLQIQQFIFIQRQPGIQSSSTEKKESTKLPLNISNFSHPSDTCRKPAPGLRWQGEDLSQVQTPAPRTAWIHFTKGLLRRILTLHWIRLRSRSSRI